MSEKTTMANGPDSDAGTGLRGGEDWITEMVDKVATRLGANVEHTEGAPY